jgi:hypothetical protein
LNAADKIVVVRYLLPLWLILITGISLAPFRVKYHLGAMGPLHAFGHMAIFLVTTVMVCSGAADTWIRLCRAGSILLFAMLCEWLELAVYGNFHFEWHDVRIDWIGVALGFAISELIHRVLEARRARELKCGHPLR